MAVTECVPREVRYLLSSMGHHRLVAEELNLRLGHRPVHMERGKMDYRYSILNDCLAVIRRCNAPTNSKLCVETLLYKMKMLLLTDSQRGDVDSSLCNIKGFEELLSQINMMQSQKRITRLTAEKAL